MSVSTSPYHSTSLARSDSRIDDVALTAARVDNRRTELAAQRRDMHVDDVREHVARLAVDVLADRRSRHQRAAIANHQLENGVLARCEVYRHVLAIHEPRGSVDRDLADNEHGRRVAAGAPHECTQARDKLGDSKRFWQIIIGPEVERFDAIVDAVERREYQDRCA